MACHNQSFLGKYDIVSELKPGGTFLLNCRWTPEELDQTLPGQVKRGLAEKNAKLYIIDANSIAQKLGLGDHASMVLQSAFFRLADIIPQEEAITYMKRAAEKSFSKKGEAVVRMNLAAIDQGADHVVEVPIPQSWLTSSGTPAPQEGEVPDFVRNIMRPCKIGRAHV